MAPLLALGISVLPALARLVAGERAGQVAATVTEAVREAAGTDDPATARERLEADPAAASALRVRLAEIALEAERLGAEAEERRRGAELEALRARIAEVRDARGTMAALAGAGSALSWGPATVSAIVTTGFFAMLALFLFWAPAAEHQQAYALLNVAVGALVAGFTAVVNFWIGSSQGSRDKDETVRRLAGQQATLVGETLGSAQSEDARFGRCLSIVLEREGGYSNDPQHPGGPTMMGITQATLARWRGEAVTAEDVRALTEEEAREIYRAGYWNPLRCDALPPGLDLMVFDFGVNAGPGASARLLQRALAVRADGAIGPITLAAARAAGARACIDRLARLREEHYRALPGFARFGRGWLNRTDHVRRAAAEMAAAVAVTA